MRLTRLELERVHAPLGAAIGNARNRWDSREGLLLRLHDDEGHVGLGEASPLPGYSTETLGDCLRALQRIDVARLPQLIAVEELSQVLDAAALPAAARCGLETAALDLLGQRTQRPMWQLLGGREARIPISALLPPDLDAWEDAAKSAIARGVRTLKCKVGVPGAFARELEALRSLRRAIGDEVQLRLDANGALPPHEVQALLSQLASVRPELIEEPVRGEALAALPAPAVPFAVDESLQGTDAIQPFLKAIRTGACRAVVLKPMALGGVLPCLRIAHVATQAGAKVIVTHLFDGPIGLAAASALALALAPHALACGLDRHPALAVWPEAQLPFLTDAELVTTPDAGLGLTLGDRA